jgi:hypothetical protein
MARKSRLTEEQHRLVLALHAYFSRLQDWYWEQAHAWRQSVHEAARCGMAAFDLEAIAAGGNPPWSLDEGLELYSGELASAIEEKAKDLLDCVLATVKLAAELERGLEPFFALAGAPRGRGGVVDGRGKRGDAPEIVVAFVARAMRLPIEAVQRVIDEDQGLDRDPGALSKKLRRKRLPEATIGPRISVEQLTAWLANREGIPVEALRGALDSALAAEGTAAEDRTSRLLGELLAVELGVEPGQVWAAIRSARSS